MMRLAKRSTMWHSAIAFAAVLPIITLVVEASADAWYGTGAWPQRWGLRGVRRVLQDPLLRASVRNSTVVATTAVLFSLLLAWPAARALATDRRRGPRYVLLAPLFVPPLAIGEGLAPWFLRLGIRDTLLAITLAHVVTVLPYVTLLLTAGFTTQLLDRETQAMLLGAPRRLRLRSVTFPAMRPHVALAVAIGFAVSWSQYGTSLVVGGGIPMLPVLVVPFMRSDRQIAAVLDLVMLVPPLLLTGLAARASAVRATAPVGASSR